MKKIFLVLLSLVVVSMFLVGCKSTGEAYGKGDILPKTCTLDSVCKDVTKLKEQARQPITANSCDADDTCEVLGITANKGIVTNYFGIGRVWITEKTVSTVQGSTSALTLTSDVRKVIVDGSLTVTDLALTTPRTVDDAGTAYACIDNSGKIFRSSGPCR